MKISVIIPIYNLERYLDRCIESLCAQNYRNLDIILVNDGSTDGSGDICERWKNKDDRIRYIQQENSGVSAARNKGLRAAEGDFIGFVDGDDWTDTSMYQRMFEEAMRHDADAVMCGYKQGTDPLHLRSCTSKGDRVMTSSEAIEACMLGPRHRGGYMTAVWNKIFKRSLIFEGNEMISFDSDFMVGEDQIWLFRILHKASKVATVSDGLYNYYYREDGAIGQRDINQTYGKHARDAVKSQLICREMLASWGESGKISNLMDARIFYHVSRILNSRPEFSDPEERTELKKILRKTVLSFVLSGNYSIYTKAKIMIPRIISGN